MTDRELGRDEFARAVEAWLETAAPSTQPPALHAAVLAATRAAGQRPTWLASLHIDLARQPRQPLQLGFPVPRRGLQLVLLLALLALGATLAGLGHQNHVPAPPLGLARNGPIAFDVDGQIVVVNTDGSGRRILAPSKAYQTSPTWSPDGTKLAFWTRSEANGRLSLTVVDADGSHGRVVTGATSYVVPSTTGDTVRPSEADWSADGARLVFAATIGDLNRIVVATLDGREPTIVGNPALPALSPTWSPDGARIAFAGGRYPDRGLYVMGADGTGVIRLTRLSGAGESFYGARWSPDGTELVYSAGDVTLNPSIWLARADGSGEQEFASPPGRGTNDTSPAWSPDGQRIAFIRADAGSSVAYLQLFVVNADGSGQVGLLHPQIDYLPPRWSPDGSRILLGTIDKTISSFVLVDVYGKQPPIFISAQGSVRGATWERLAP